MNTKLKPIQDQVMVITGASSGIGLATAKEACRRGAKVVMSSRSGRTLQEIADDLNAGGGQAIAVKADVSDKAQVQQIADAAIAHFGRIDTWVNNAGLSIYGKLEDIGLDDARQLFEINFWGVVYGSMIAMPFLRKNGGALINVGSEVSEAVAPLQGMYSASKHAVKGFTDCLRIEVEQVDHAPVSITLIQPTAVNTPFAQHAKNYLSREPRLPDPMIEPQKVAQAICDAAEHPARYVKVGIMARFNTFLANNVPAVADRMAASYVEKQQQDKPSEHAEGTLYVAGEGGEEYGQPPAAHI